MKKPENTSEYKSWCKAHLKVDFDDEKSRTLYETNLNLAYSAIEEHKFFRNLGDKLRGWVNSYKIQTGSLLLMTQEVPKLTKKTYESAVDKSFRVNVLRNAKFPAAPNEGWVTPKNLYHYFNDVIRGTLVCRFIDGPKYIASRLTELAKSLGLKSKYYSQEREDGYYAYHFYVFVPVKLVDESFNRFDADVEVEIQVTTQLQEVLRSLTHQFYEVNRLKLDKGSSKWKWDYRSNRFKVSYLSHTLHLLESIIVESRSSSIKKARTNKK